MKSFLQNHPVLDSVLTAVAGIAGIVAVIFTGAKLEERAAQRKRDLNKEPIGGLPHNVRHDRSIIDYQHHGMGTSRTRDPHHNVGARPRPNAR